MIAGRSEVLVRRRLRRDAGRGSSKVRIWWAGSCYDAMIASALTAHLPFADRRIASMTIPDPWLPA